MYNSPRSTRFRAILAVALAAFIPAAALNIDAAAADSPTDDVASEAPAVEVATTEAPIPPTPASTDPPATTEAPATTAAPTTTLTPPVTEAPPVAPPPTTIADSPPPQDPPPSTVPQPPTTTVVPPPVAGPQAPGPPVNTVAPVLSGTPVVGQTLSVTTGEWTSDSPITYTYQWFGCFEATEGSCTGLGGATASSLLLQYWAKDFWMQVRVTATNIDGESQVETNRVGPVTSPPVNDSLPHVGGAPYTGETLSAIPGTWTSDSPITYTYQWQHCTLSSCSDIVGATGTTYALTATDLGLTLKFIETATNDVGSTDAASWPSSKVTVPPALDAPATAEPGSSITVSGNGFFPNSDVDLTLHSDPYPLGTITVNGDGMFSTTVTLPTGVTGTHSIKASGWSILVSPLVLSTSITLEAAPPTTTTPPTTVPPTTTPPAGPDGAGDSGSDTGGTQLGETTTASPQDATQAAESNPLASTGASSLQMVLFAAALLFSGFLMVSTARARRSFERRRHS